MTGNGVLVSIFIRTFGAFIATEHRAPSSRAGGRKKKGERETKRERERERQRRGKGEGKG